MLIEFSIKNYRSIKDKITFSMLADGFDSKPQNLNIINLSNGKLLRLHNTAFIYGPNGSGKSNIVLFLYTFLRMIRRSNHTGEHITEYDPFCFDSDTQDQPTEFEIKFIGINGIPYLYTVSYTYRGIFSEKLSYWPNGRETEAFTRSFDNFNDETHTLNIGNAAQEDSKAVKVYYNNFGLSHFSSLSPNKVISGAYKSLQKISVLNSLNSLHISPFKDTLGILLKDADFSKRINALINYSDLNINSLFAIDNPNPSEGNKYFYETTHSFYENNLMDVQEITLDLKDESQGSKTVIGLGTEIILTLDSGGLLVVDEIETSLHPNLCKALISIFQNKKLNKKNAQLIFTTHDTNLMDHTLFRRDQIWFTNKDNKGVTELYSMIDFNELRESHVYEKWYMSGKFGAIPNLESIEKAFGDEKNPK